MEWGIEATCAGTDGDEEGLNGDSWKWVPSLWG